MSLDMSAFAEFSGRGGTDLREIRALETATGHALPQDFIEFLRNINGGDGFIGQNYLMLWGADEIARFNVEYQAGKYAPGLLLIGSSGGGEAFALDYRSGSVSVCCVPFVGMALRHVNTVAPSFDAFVRRLVAGDIFG